MRTKTKIAVYDFFCGCGGTSVGFRKAGFDIVFALDIDKDATKTFELNFPKAVFHEGDIRNLDIKKLKSVMDKHLSHYSLFCACAPCQPYTKQRTDKRGKDDRLGLLENFIPLVKKFRPNFVFIENVPGLCKTERNNGLLKKLEENLEYFGYYKDYGIVAAQDFGAPQMRRRFILLASRIGNIELPKPAYGLGRDKSYRTVRDAISDMPNINAGESHPDTKLYPNHRAADLSEMNMRRIKMTPRNGGGRLSLPAKLQLQCHKKTDKNGKIIYGGHTDVYGRLWWDRPSPGLTTRCISLSNGRYGHPEQNRAISVREAARLQGFPDDFVFTGNLNSMAKQVGNAVPVDLALSVGKHFAEHLKQNETKAI